MPRLTPETRFDLVHVGKCGGSTVAGELLARGFRYEYVHMRRPVVAQGRRYVVLVRDPVARFVSAFNWRKQLFATEVLPLAQDPDPVSRLRHRCEREFLAQFDDVNAFAERLARTGEHEVSPTATLMQLIGHVPQGFVWYLDELLDRIEPGQLAAVIATERLADDCEAVFGFRPTAEQNRSDGARGTGLSPGGRANLARELAAEYRTLGRLARLARRDGVRLSVAYDPALGAMPA